MYGSECSINTQSWNFSQCIDEQEAELAVYQNGSTACPSFAACSSQYHGQQSVGIAIGLVIATGLTTVFGALGVTLLRGKLPVRKLLAGGLAAAVGLMLYLAFAELWLDSAGYFCCVFPSSFSQYLAASASFLMGILLTGGLRACEWFLRELERTPWWQECTAKLCRSFLPAKIRIRLDLMGSTPAVMYAAMPSEARDLSAEGECLDDKGKDLSDGEDKVALLNEESSPTVEGKPRNDKCVGDLSTAALGIDDEMEATDHVRIPEHDEHGTVDPPEQEESLQAMGPAEFREVTDAVVHDKKHLTRMGVLTGLAIAIHNFPKGVATFVGSLSSPSLGGVLAFAIAIHNIPEGICVAMPIYYATGSKWKGIFWASLSGASEPIGAILAYVVLRSVFSPLVYGICFGLISGMMVYIALKELLPTAYRLTTKSGAALVPLWLFIGMLVMSLCLVLRRLTS